MLGGTGQWTAGHRHPRAPCPLEGSRSGEDLGSIPLRRVRPLEEHGSCRAGRAPAQRLLCREPAGSLSVSV